MSRPLTSVATATVSLLLLAAGMLLLGACSDTSGGSADRASQRIAEVNGDEISVHLLNQWIGQQAALAGGPPAAAELDRISRAGLERLIEQELLVQQAQAAKLDRDPQVLQALALARREVLARAYAQRLAASATPPQEAELRAWYDARPLLFARRQLFELRETLLPTTPEQFESLRVLLAGGATLVQIGDWMRAQKLPSQGSRSVQPAEGLPAAWLEPLSKMRDGQALLLGTAGAARIVVRASATDAPLAFEAVRPAIEQRLMAERRRDAVATAITTLRRDARVAYHGRFAQAASAPADAASASVSAAAPGLAAAPASAIAAAPLPATSPTASAPAAAVARGMAGLR